jgi:hypothetical protein
VSATAAGRSAWPAHTASAVRNGSTLMAVAAAGFIGYAALFLVRSFTDSFLELGIGPAEVSVGKDQSQQFSPSLYHYISNLHVAVSGFIAATGLAGLLLATNGIRSGQLWAWAAVASPVLGPDPQARRRRATAMTRRRVGAGRRQQCISPS